MSDVLTSKHAAEFASALSNHAYEIADEQGLYFPKARTFMQGMYVHDVNGQDERTDHNLNPDEALQYLLSVGLYNGTKIATWYLAPYAANYTPLAALTAASFPATAAEITSNSEGYTETTRPIWVPSAPAAGNFIDNFAAKTAFTIATASSLTINGLALLSDATKGATTGKIMSAVKFTAARTLYNTDVFNAAFRVQLTSS